MSQPGQILELLSAVPSPNIIDAIHQNTFQMGSSWGPHFTWADNSMDRQLHGKECHMMSQTIQQDNLLYCSPLPQSQLDSQPPGLQALRKHQECFPEPAPSRGRQDPARKQLSFQCPLCPCTRCKLMRDFKQVLLFGPLCRKLNYGMPQQAREHILTVATETS